MYKNHFGFKHAILDKAVPTLWKNKQYDELLNQFNGLLSSPGVGLLTGHSGVGKTITLNHIIQHINPHQYKVMYNPETNLCQLEIYQNLAVSLGIEPSYRRSKLWRDIKETLLMLYDQASVLPLWIIDEAHYLPVDFFKDLPAFLNFKFDSKMPITIWLVGYPELSDILNRQSNEALRSRLHVRYSMKPLTHRDDFKQ